MLKSVTLPALLLFSLPILPAQNAAPHTLSRRQVRHLSANAHTRQEFRTLAEHFHAQHALHEREAAEQAHLLKQEREQPSFGKSYPTPAVGEERLREHYQELAKLDEEREQMYTARLRKAEAADKSLAIDDHLAASK